ncbi:MAG: hypothetical protein JO186_09450 [Actinobacteria bacterium]|nr:hypothetical protein [Actinomycetota bacterium]
MRARLAQREAALALVALLAGVVAAAIVFSTRGRAHGLPVPVGSYTGLAAAMSPSAVGRRTSCGIELTSETQGVAHPVLPCGTRIYITYDGVTVLTQVVAHRFVVGAQFAFTPALAGRLDLTGVRAITWSYAQSN